MRHLMLHALVFAGLLSPAAASARPASPYAVTAPAVSHSGDLTTLRGRICRTGVGRPGAPVVEISPAVALSGGGQFAPVRLDGDLRGRAGGCAYYSAQVPRSTEPVKICVRDALTANSRVCL